MAKGLFGKRKEASGDDKLKEIRSRIDEIFETTKPVRDQMTHNLELFEGNLWNKSDVEFQGHQRSDAQYNTIFSAIQSVAPMVTDNRPITRVAPRFPWMEKLGVALNHMTKYFWNALDMQMVLYRAVLDSMIFGHAIFKLGYNPDKTYGGEVELAVVDPRDFFVAPGYETIWDAPFCGIKTDKPVSWVKRNFDVDEVKGAVDMTKSDKSKKNYKFGEISSISDDCNFVTVYELWTRDDDAYEEFFEEDENGEKRKQKKQKYPYGKICYFTEQQWLGEEAAQDEHNLPPYVEMWDYIKPHDFTGMSEVTQIEGLHKELNLLLKYITEYVRRYHNPNILINQDSQIDSELIKSKYWEGGQAFSYSAMASMGNDPVQQMAEPQMNPQVFNLFTIIPSIIEEVSGVTDVTKGQVGKQERQSASEIAILLESSHTRTRQRVRNLEWSLKRIYYMILRLTMQHYDTPRTVSYEEDGQRVYAEYGNDKAMADQLMQPSPLPNSVQERMNNGMIRKEEGFWVGNPEDIQILQKHEREMRDYEKFLSFFDDVGDTDPIFFDFDIEIQTDSMLPMDKQARANLYMRLLQMSPGPAQLAMFKAVLEYLQIPNRDEIIESMEKALQAAQQKQGGGGPSPQDQQLMQQNPALAQRYQQAMAQRSGQ